MCKQNFAYDNATTWALMHKPFHPAAGALRNSESPVRLQIDPEKKWSSRENAGEFIKKSRMSRMAASAIPSNLSRYQRLGEIPL